MELLKQQLHTKDEQLSQLSQLMAMDRQERERLVQQLNHTHAQIEDHRTRGWWFQKKR
ncbi:hypothetical protein HYR99_27995 [Candidatus Poribacteria bacterium]|nr:hypothetical protein [Candidatus Poribacteria bacterium]